MKLSEFNRRAHGANSQTSELHLSFLPPYCAHQRNWPAGALSKGRTITINTIDHYLPPDTLADFLCSSRCPVPKCRHESAASFPTASPVMMFLCPLAAAPLSARHALCKRDQPSLSLCVCISHCCSAAVPVNL